MKKQIFFFLAVVGVLFSGCGAKQEQIKAPVQVEETFKSEILKDLIEPRLEKKTVSLERTPVNIMESFISPYTNGNKSIGEHKILMVIDYGKWNSSSKKDLEDNSLIGGVNE